MSQWYFTLHILVKQRPRFIQIFAINQIQLSVQHIYVIHLGRQKQNSHYLLKSWMQISSINLNYTKVPKKVFFIFPLTEVIHAYLLWIIFFFRSWLWFGRIVYTWLTANFLSSFCFVGSRFVWNINFYKSIIVRKNLAVYYYKYNVIW